MTSGSPHRSRRFGVRREVLAVCGVDLAARAHWAGAFVCGLFRTVRLATRQWPSADRLEVHLDRRRDELQAVRIVTALPLQSQQHPGLIRRRRQHGAADGPVLVGGDAGLLDGLLLVDQLRSVPVGGQRLRPGEVVLHGRGAVAEHLLDDPRALCGDLGAGPLDGPVVPVDRLVAQAAARRAEQRGHQEHDARVAGARCLAQASTTRDLGAQAAGRRRCGSGRPTAATAIRRTGAAVSSRWARSRSSSRALPAGSPDRVTTRMPNSARPRRPAGQRRQHPPVHDRRHEGHRRRADEHPPEPAPKRCRRGQQRHRRDHRGAGQQIHRERTGARRPGREADRSRRP